MHPLIVTADAVGGPPSWLEAQFHRDWVTAQAMSLWSFFRASMDPEGWWVELDDDGRALPTGCPPGVAPRQNLLTVARMTHSYALGELLGVPGCAGIVECGLAALWERHRDRELGGYIEAIGRPGPDDKIKTLYGHAHVILAASSALVAGHDPARNLLADVLAVLDEHFWSEHDGAGSEAYDHQWRELESYRGANSNMHLCEALLAAADAADRPDLVVRAERLVRRFADGYARAHQWLLPEHFSPDWAARLDYNAERLDDPFRPYGATLGHSLEWARLALAVQLAAGTTDASLLEASEALFDRAVALGWDHALGGLPYTVNWDGSVANPDHYFWPVAEGIATSSYLFRTTGKPVYETWYRRFWEFAATHLIDHQRGGWYPLLDARNRRKVHPWYGKPDVYHSLQACLLPIMPMASSAAGAVRMGAQQRR